jgi:N4-(beta-N-acetylglucosaminyl)-L-asparaginase
MPPIAIATWDFGLQPCQAAIESLGRGSTELDAVESGIRLAESDATNRSVGIGGIPNAAGVVQLDASIMAGDRRAGAVAALEGFPHPISVAKRVLTETPHVMLAGDGAAQFAVQQGFQRVDLLVDRERQAYAEWLQRKKPEQSPGVDPVRSDDPTRQSPKTPQPDLPENHDTIALLVCRKSGSLAGGCSTSGWGYKLPGRVGDSPIIGSGLYVDNLAGAAGATGLGEIMMRYCGSFLVVEAMRRGATPEAACIEAVERIIAGEGKQSKPLSVNFIALSPDGRVGAAGTDAGFRYAVATAEKAEIRRPQLVG